MSSCSPGPVPPMGWHIFRGPVTPELSQWAVSLLHGIGNVPYGQTWIKPYGTSMQIMAIKQRHTWTYRGGKLVSGICIPGITLYTKPNAATPPTPPQLGDTTPPELPQAGDIAAFNEAPTDWPIVIASAGAILTVSILFALALKHAGRAARKR